MDYFVLSSNPIKQLVFFNYDHGDNQSFFAQFQPFIDQLSPLLTTPISKKNEFQQLTPFINLELDSFSNLQNYQALYGLKSVSEQNLDQSLTLINDLGVSDRWSQWSKIAFKHCIEQNLKLNTLLAKAKLIANLNQTYHQFLTTYSYEAF